MAIYVYLSKGVREECSKLGVLPRIEKNAQDIEAKQSLAHFRDTWPPPALTRAKWPTYNMRLIAAELHLDGHLVVVYLRVLIRGDGEYDKFKANAAAYVNRYLDEERDHTDLRAWLADRTRVNPPPFLPELSAAEASLLWDASASSIEDDVVFYETREWRKAVEDERLSRRLINLPDALLGLGDDAPDRGVSHLSVGSPAVKVLYRSYSELKRVVLLTALFDPTSDMLEKALSYWSDRLDSILPADVPRLGCRGYPALLLTDADLWDRIEKDEHANLVLSPEEAEILQAVQHNKSDARRGYPLFINGQAGSGKSTLLHYLFAGCFSRWCRTFREPTLPVGRPVYFACSAALLNQAQERVRSLLNLNHNFVLEHGGQEIPQLAFDHLEHSFQNFREYLRAQLSEEERRLNFPAELYVDFGKFRRHWTDRFGFELTARRDFGPQLSWHVIRSYIKGLSVEGLLDLEEYDELSHDERTVSSERFALVYERVWEGWYKSMRDKDRYWDDQDLARYLVEQDRISPRFCGIFCDEAQDFTRIEIELLYRLSLYSGRRVPHDGVHLVPFAFAGDPFQTLNPTGFRWEAIKSGFTERLLRSLHRYKNRTSLPELNYRELTLNYRCGQEIVNFCNTIQALRSAQFALPSIGPQSCWAIETKPPRVKYFPEDASGLMEATSRKKAELVILVPCDEGQEAEYVRKSQVLSAIVPLDKQSGTPDNVLSAARAKGLEFSRVVLFGFGQEEEARKFRNWAARQRGDTLSNDDSLPFEYFMNRLYVGASRAKQRLVVIDSKEALADFWEFAKHDKELDRILKMLGRRSQAWVGHLTTMEPGRPEDWEGNQDDPRELAEKYEAEGRRNHDSYLMNLAARRYGQLGEPMHESLCRAMGAEFDGSHIEAAGHYRQALKPQEALSSFWKGNAYDKLVRFAAEEPAIAQAIECRVASFILGADPPPEVSRKLLEQIREKASQDAYFVARLASSPWEMALATVLERALKPAPSSAAALTAWIGLVSEIDVLSAAGAAFKPPQRAEVELRAGHYKKALEFLKGSEETTVFREAKVRLLLQQKEEGQTQFDSADALLVSRVLLQERKRDDSTPISPSPHAEAAWWASQAGDLAMLWRSIEALLDPASGSTLEASANAVGWALEELVRLGAWTELTHLCQHGRTPEQVSDRRDRTRVSLPKWNGPAANRFLKLLLDWRIVERFVIPALARSDRLAHDRGEEKAKVRVLIEPIFLTETIQWSSKFPVAVAGSVVERVCLDIQALAFYERIVKDAQFSLHDREFADRRWTRCKIRQADRDKRTSSRKAADDALLRLGLEEKELLEYPDLEAETGPAAHTTPEPIALVPVSWTWGDLRFEAFPPRRRINVTSITQGDTLQIDLGATTPVTSPNLKIEPQDPGPNSWECRQWELVVIVDNETVTIRTPRGCRSVMLAGPALTSV